MKEMGTKEASLKEMNEQWKSFFDANRIRWVTEFLPKTVHMLKTLNFKDIKYEVEQNGFVDNTYYIKIFHLEIVSEEINFDLNNKKLIEFMISNIDSETNGNTVEWKVDGYFEYYDSYEGSGTIAGGDISKELRDYHEIEISENRIQEILEDFRLQKKGEDLMNKLIVEKDKEEENKLKQRFGDLVKSIKKNHDYYNIEFSNGVTLKGDIHVLLHDN